MTRILVLICAVLAGVAEAAVYRCEVQGRTVYTDHPCAAGAAPHALPELSRVPSETASDLAEQFDERREQDLKDKRKSDAEWLKAHESRRAIEARMREAAREGQVLKDMTPDQVRRALGGPDEVERGADGEQWVYGNGKSRRTVVFKQGRVVRISGKKP